MRVEIKTKGKPITDKDVRALYIIGYGLNESSSDMKLENLKFFVDKMGYNLTRKEIVRHHDNA